AARTGGDAERGGGQGSRRSDDSLHRSLQEGSVGAPEGPAAVDVKGSPAAVVAGEDLRDVDAVLGLKGNQGVALEVDQFRPFDLAEQLGELPERLVGYPDPAVGVLGDGRLADRVRGGAEGPGAGAALRVR